MNECSLDMSIGWYLHLPLCKFAFMQEDNSETKQARHMLKHDSFVDDESLLNQKIWIMEEYFLFYLCYFQCNGYVYNILLGLIWIMNTFSFTFQVLEISKIKASFLVADFPGVNTSIMANFKLLAWFHWMQSWEEIHRIMWVYIIQF